MVFDPKTGEVLHELTDEAKKDSDKVISELRKSLVGRIVDFAKKAI